MSSGYSYGGRADIARLAVRTYPAPISLARAAGLAEIGGSDAGEVSRDIAGLVNCGWLELQNDEVKASERLVASARGLKVSELQELVGDEGRE